MTKSHSDSFLSTNKNQKLLNNTKFIKRSIWSKKLIVARDT